MKRRMDASSDLDDENPSKQPRLDEAEPPKYAFDDPTLQIVNLASIRDNLDERSWFEARCFMKYNTKPSKLRRFVMRSDEFEKFDLELHGPEVMQDSVDSYITNEDVVQFSLKGATLKSKSATGYLSFTLVYKDGVQFRVASAKANPEKVGLLFDAWKIRENTRRIEERARAAANDWFVTPAQSEADIEDAEPTNDDSDLEVIPSPPTSHTLESTPAPRTPTEVLMPRESTQEGKTANSEKSSRRTESSHFSEDISAADADIAIDDHGKQKRKRVRKADTRYANADRSGSKQSADVPKRRHQDANTSNTEKGKRIDQGYDDIRKRGGWRNKNSRRERSPIPTPPRPIRNPALDLQAGIRCETRVYPALDSLKSLSTVSLIVIVLACSEVKSSRTGDQYITLSVVDPSKYHNAFSVNVFADRNCVDWLPRLSQGHVLLLHNIKITGFKDDSDRLNGVVYKDKISWAAFNPETGRFYHNDQAGAPVQSQAPGSSYNPFGINELRPFYSPRDEREIEYCSSIGEWWRAVKEEEQRTRVPSVAIPRAPRQHRLIGDMKVNEFFNATVEVIRVGEVEERNQRLVVVSDYTMHPELGHGGEMGPFGHTTFTTQMPEDVVEEIKEGTSGDDGSGGTFWRISNIRLKTNSNGYVELDLHSAKWGRLDEDEDEDELDKHLKELLERKKSYEESPYNPNIAHAVEDDEVSLISEAIGDKKFVNLAVEVLFVSREREVAIDVYVTDYTACEGAALYRPTAMQRTVGSNVPVFKVIIWRNKFREESSVVPELCVGSIYRLMNVLIGDDGRGNLVGHINRATESVRKVTVKGSEAEDVVELKRRKRKFYGTEEDELSGPSGAQGVPAYGDAAYKQPAVSETEGCNAKTAPVGSFTVHSWHLDQKQNTIEQIRRNQKCPNKFSLTARVVDYFPLDMAQFAWRRCMTCKKKIHDSARACLDCGDMEHKYIEWKYRFFLRLEDREGNQIDVAVCDEAEAFLNGLKPTDFQSDQNALKSLRIRLGTLFGNIDEVHEGLRKNETVVPKYGPYFDMAIKSWYAEVDGTQNTVYALTGCSMREVEGKKAYVK